MQKKKVNPIKMANDIAKAAEDHHNKMVAKKSKKIDKPGDPEEEAEGHSKSPKKFKQDEESEIE